MISTQIRKKKEKNSNLHPAISFYRFLISRTPNPKKFTKQKKHTHTKPHHSSINHIHDIGLENHRATRNPDKSHHLSTIWSRARFAVSSRRLDHRVEQLNKRHRIYRGIDNLLLLTNHSRRSEGLVGGGGSVDLLESPRWRGRIGEISIPRHRYDRGRVE